jgi:hypothetical protein
MTTTTPDDYDDGDALHDEDSGSFVLDGAGAGDAAAEADQWERLLSELDFQAGKWYMFDPGLDRWEVLQNFRLAEVLYSFGVGSEPKTVWVDEQHALKTGVSAGWRQVPDPARDRIKRLFRYRDRESNRVAHSGEHRARAFDPERLAAMIAPPEPEPPRPKPPKRQQDDQQNLSL